MLANGIATIFVSNMDRSVQFYTATLGMRLAQRFGNHWAQVEAGQTAIGLHPASEHHAAGRNGSITIGLTCTEPIEQVVQQLKQKGVAFEGGVIQDNAGKVAY